MIQSFRIFSVLFLALTLGLVSAYAGTTKNNNTKSPTTATQAQSNLSKSSPPVTKKGEPSKFRGAESLQLSTKRSTPQTGTTRSKADSRVWQSLSPYRGPTKYNGQNGKKRRLFQWDYTHSEVEMYDGRGKHLGAIDAQTGKQIKGPVRGRVIKQ